MSEVLSRRQFIQGTSGALAAAIGADARFLSVAQPTSESLLAPPLKPFNVWDDHCHLRKFQGATPEEKMADMIRHADLIGISRMCVTRGMRMDDASVEGMRRENDDVMRAVASSRGRALGLCFLRPQHLEACLDELNRCVRNGPMVGVGELENDVLCNTPAIDPIFARIVSLKVPILHHTWIKTTGNDPNESTPQDLVELARRHPDGCFVCMHTGGTWELGIRAIRDTKNVYAEIAGSDPTSGFVEMAVRELGAERVIYGSDAAGRSFASQLAKVLGANVPDSTKELVLGGNLRRILTPILQARGYRA